jgi:hypothetical protein
MWNANWIFSENCDVYGKIRVLKGREEVLLKNFRL